MASQSQTADDAWSQIQDDILPAEGEYRNNYDDERILRDDDTVLVVAAPGADEYWPIADNTDVPVTRINDLMHDRARNLTDYDWSASFPVVVEK